MPLHHLTGRRPRNECPASPVPVRAYSRNARLLGGPLYRAVANDVLRLDPRAGARVLDIGTGPGLLPHRLVRRRPDLLIDGVDLSPEMTAIAARAAPASNLTFTTADVAALPFPEGTFDVVISTLSQHEWDDPEAGMREIHRVLAPAGTALLYDFRASLARARRAAEAGGLKVVPNRPGVLLGRLDMNR